MAYDASTTDTAGGKGHNAPCSNRDFDFFYQGLEDGKVLIQKCADCGTLRNPPGPACPECHSFKWTAVPFKGTGTVYSYTIHHHPPLPGFQSPHPVVLAEMDEGVRLVGAMDGTSADQIRIGLPVVVELVRRDNVASFRFRPA